jgi:predicted peptidase
MAFPLLVALSGGGADEERAVLQLAMAGYGPRAGRKAGDLIILSPTTDASMSWYTGDAGDEVLACIAHMKKLYNVNEKAIILDGFDSGGYGALRLALLHPDVFKGVMVRSGLFIPPAAAKGEAISSLFERAKTLNILIVHGDNDQTAPIEEARKVVAGLQELKANVQFIEVKEGGHGDYDRWSEIFGWLKDVLGDAVVVTKPPKKEREKEKEKEQFQIILSW